MRSCHNCFAFVLLLMGLVGPSVEPRIELGTAKTGTWPAVPCFLFLFCFWAAPGNAQGLVKGGGKQGMVGGGNKTWVIECPTHLPYYCSGLPAVLSVSKTESSRVRLSEKFLVFVRASDDFSFLSGLFWVIPRRAQSLFLPLCSWWGNQT